MNLIKNSCWIQTSAAGGPQYFTGTGPVTFDNFFHKGNRTCSLTMASGTASDSYTEAIDVSCRCAVQCGYIIRALEAQSVMLSAEFSDAAGKVIATIKTPIQDSVKCYFRRISARFAIPTGAQTVKFSLLFEGKVTAATFCAPSASFVA